MIVNLSSGIKQTLLYGASIALMKGVSLLMLPIFAYHLTPDDFGRLEVVTSLAIIGSVLVGMGLEDALYRFAGSADSEQQRRDIAAEIFSIAMLLGGAAGLFGWWIAEPLANWMPGDAITYEVQLVLWLLMLEGCIAIPLGWLRMSNQALLFFGLNTGRAMLQASLALWLLTQGRGVAGVLEAGLFAALTQALLLSVIHIRDVGISFSYQTTRQAVVYSAPIMASALVAFALNGLDRWLLADYTTLTDVALFGVAAKFALPVILLMQPFTMWWNPRRFAVLKEPNGAAKASKFIVIGLVLTLAISLPVGLAAPLLISWLLPESYALAGHYAIALVVVMMLKEMADLINVGCFIGKTTGSQFAINTISAICGVSAMLYWIPEYAVWGVIGALIMARGLRLLLFIATSQHYLPLPYPIRSLVLVTAITLVTLTLGFFSNHQLGQLSTMIVGGCCLALVTVAMKLIPIPHRHG